VYLPDPLVAIIARHVEEHGHGTVAVSKTTGACAPDVRRG